MTERWLSVFWTHLLPSRGFFPDEVSKGTDALLAQVVVSGAAVPVSWFSEVANGLGVAERRNRITPSDLDDAVFILGLLALEVDARTSSTEWIGEILTLMRRFGLSGYDAAYLELAHRRKLPLATLDRKIQAAAGQAGVALVSGP